MEVFVHKGYTDATIPEIAKSSDLAVGTLYIYYPNKRELFISVIENLMIVPIADVFAKKANEEFPTIMKNALENRMGFLQGNTLNQLSALMSEILRDPELRDMYAEKLIKPFISHMENIYRSRVASGEFRKLKPEIIVRLIDSMMIGMSLLRNIEGESSPLNLMSQEKLEDEIMNFILFGLMNRNREFKQEMR